MFAADLRDVEITCPHCSAHYFISADPSISEQEYVEDCQVCCAPILLHLHVDMVNELILVDTQRENY